MIKLGLIGYPLGHSLSAIMQTAALKHLGIEGTYELLETPPEDLIDRIKYLKTRDYAGFNVTIPLKVPMMLFLEQVDEFADLAGCINTVKIMENKTFNGYNTDIYGFIKAIPENVRQKLVGKKAVVVGSGGASRAAIISLAKLGVKNITIVSRNIANSSSMVNGMREKFSDTVFELKQISSVKDLSDVYLLVNTTPVGMRGHSEGFTPILKEVLDTMDNKSVIYDLIYNPIKTKLIELGEKKGLTVINGLDMLVNQGARAFEIWTGQKPDINVMKNAALLGK